MLNKLSPLSKLVVNSGPGLHSELYSDFSCNDAVAKGGVMCGNIGNYVNSQEFWKISSFFTISEHKPTQTSR